MKNLKSLIFIPLLLLSTLCYTKEVKFYIDSFDEKNISLLRLIHDDFQFQIDNLGVVTTELVKKPKRAQYYASDILSVRRNDLNRENVQENLYEHDREKLGKLASSSLLNRTVEDTTIFFRNSRLMFTDDNTDTPLADLHIRTGSAGEDALYIDNQSYLVFGTDVVGNKRVKMRAFGNHLWLANDAGANSIFFTNTQKWGIGMGNESDPPTEALQVKSGNIWCNGGDYLVDQGQHYQAAGESGTFYDIMGIKQESNPPALEIGYLDYDGNVRFYRNGLVYIQFDSNSIAMYKPVYFNSWANMVGSATITADAYLSTFTASGYGVVEGTFTVKKTLKYTTSTTDTAYYFQFNGVTKATMTPTEFLLNGDAIDHLAAVPLRQVQELVEGNSFDFWLTTGTNDIAGYRTLLSTESENSRSTITVTGISGSGVEIATFTTLAGHPNFNLLVAGSYILEVHASKTGNKTVKLWWDVYTRDTGGNETILIASERQTISNDDEHWRIHGSTGGDTDIDNDRIVLRVLADVSGGGAPPDVSIYMEGNTNSRFETRTNLTAFDNRYLLKETSNTFVLKAGSTMTGNLTVPEVNVSSINARDNKGLFLLDDGNNGIFIEDGGKVGIGTAKPGTSLELQSSSPILRLRDTGATANATIAYVEFGGTDAGVWSRTGYVGDRTTANTDIYLHAEESDLHLGDSSGINVLNLKDGNVGISTATPVTKFEVANGSITISGTNANLALEGTIYGSTAALTTIVMDSSGTISGVKQIVWANGEVQVSSPGAGGGGDMTKAVYDTGDNGIVDNSEALSGYDYTKFVDTHTSQNISEDKSFIKNKGIIYTTDEGTFRIYGKTDRLSLIYDIANTVDKIYYTPQEPRLIIDAWTFINSSLTVINTDTSDSTVVYFGSATSGGFRVSTNNVYSAPNQSYVHLRMGSAQSPADELYTKINFDTVVKDTQNEYNATTSSIVVRNKGSYLIICSIAFETPIDSMPLELVLYKNGVALQGNWFVTAGTYASGFILTTIEPFEAGDALTMHVWYNSSSTEILTNYVAYVYWKVKKLD